MHDNYNLAKKCWEQYMKNKDKEPEEEPDIDAEIEMQRERNYEYIQRSIETDPSC